MATNPMKTRLPAGLIGLLTYQWVAVMSALGMGCSIARFTLQAIKDLPGLRFNLLSVLVFFAWGATMAVVSVRMIRPRPRAFLVGMVCHLFLAIFVLICMLAFLVMASEGSLGGHGMGWEPVFLLIALMCSPFVLISAWAFYYLRKFRKSLLLVDPEATEGMPPKSPE